VIETSTNIIALTAAILKVQGELSGVKKDGKNPHFKSNYATLENVIDTARPALQAAKIVFVQAPGQVIGGAVEVTTMLVHESGEWMRSTRRGFRHHLRASLQPHGDAWPAADRR
jgi:hypothetical protein